MNGETAKIEGSAKMTTAYVTPECRVGHEHPGFRHGCPSCRAPGYQHPVLGWMPVPCACTCHTEEAAS
ncbi:hypothetical protein [Streptacidiphilus cavernicola]|uniref:Uncharacterized protein n=1 Tax=Streptacidiphilus cavernicola TaxID=3342716 RepID=A0ABV6VRJ8_9ACTN